MTLKVEVSEALCSALYQMPFAEFLGEADVAPDGDHHLWFHLGERPKDMRVTVIRSKDDEWVDLRLEWRNYHADPRNPLRGSQTIRLNTFAATQTDLRHPTETALLRVLEVFQDVVEEKGVAGEIAKLAPPTPEEDEDDPDW